MLSGNVALYQRSVLMNGRKFSLTDLPGICKAILTGKSEREIQKRFGCSPSTAHKYKKRLTDMNITFEKLFSIPLDELIREVCPNVGSVSVTAKSASVTHTRSRHIKEGAKTAPEPEFAKLAAKVKAEKSTIWNEWTDYRSRCSVLGQESMSRSWFYRKLSAELAKLGGGTGVSMSQDHRYGDALMIDWSGTELSFVAGDGRTTVSYPLFVAVFPASNYTMAIAMTDMTTASVCMATGALLRRAGVKPKWIVTDNMKSSVTRNARGKGAIMNASFMRYLSRMNIDAEACNPASPTVKNEVEHGVANIKRRVLVRMKTMEFPDLDEANRALMELTDRYINREEFTSADRKGISRALLFEKYERPACRPVGKLPVWSEHFESLKVSRFYTVRINGTQYSVPYVFAGSYVSADIIDGTVHIYSPTGEIATHPRAANGTEKVISPGHMPESHRAEHEKRKKYATDEDILLAAGEFGDRVASLCRSMLAPGQRREARKACIAIINFCKRNRRDAAILSEAARATLARPLKERNYYTFERFFREIAEEKLRKGSYGRQTELDFCRLAPSIAFLRGNGKSDGGSGSNKGD